MKEAHDLKIIDLTAQLKPGMKVYPGDPEVKITVVNTHEKHSWELRELNVGTHTGTHVDAFSHMVEDGRTLDEIPLTQFFGDAQVVDPEDVFPKGMGLFFVSKVGVELLEKILLAGPPFVGGMIDLDLERALLENGVVTYTNLVDLELLPKNRTFTFYGLPLKIKDGDGSPVRAIALTE